LAHLHRGFEYRHSRRSHALGPQCQPG
jgi:hypothetical protein